MRIRRKGALQHLKMACLALGLGHYEDGYNTDLIPSSIVNRHCDKKPQISMEKNISLDHKIGDAGEEENNISSLAATNEPDNYFSTSFHSLFSGSTKIVSSGILFPDFMYLIDLRPASGLLTHGFQIPRSRREVHPEICVHVGRVSINVHDQKIVMYSCDIN